MLEIWSFELKKYQKNLLKIYFSLLRNFILLWLDNAMPLHKPPRIAHLNVNVLKCHKEPIKFVFLTVALVHMSCVGCPAGKALKVNNSNSELCITLVECACRSNLKLSRYLELRTTIGPVQLLGSNSAQFICNDKQAYNAFQPILLPVSTYKWIWFSQRWHIVHHVAVGEVLGQILLTYLI